jgi:dihydrofolate reductase
MKVSLIVAVTDNGVIGRDGVMPWYLPSDLTWFKETTWGHYLVMGRRTFETVGEALPGRTTVVVSRSRPELPAGVALAGSLGEALELARCGDDDEAFVAGGAEIYRLALPLADRIYLTRIHTEIDGDAFFPDPDPAVWEVVASNRREADSKNRWPHTFEVYERRGGAAAGV